MITIISKNDGLDDKYLKSVNQDECRKVISHCSSTRSAINLNNNNGYSKDKFMRMESMIPRSIYFSPHYKHIFHNPDPIEKERLTKLFLEKYSKFKTVEKL